MNPHITTLRERLQRTAQGLSNTMETYQGVGEEDMSEEFTVIFNDGTEISVLIQEGGSVAK